MSAGARDPHPGPLEAAARELAQRHGVSQEKARLVPALARLHAVPDWLARARARLAVPEGPTAKAAEWLLDNGYLVQRAVRQIRHDLPADFYARLPVLAAGDDRGTPRIYAVACALLRASEVQLAPPNIIRFVNAYQEIAPLEMGELWALPPMLRLRCLEVLVAAMQRLVPALAVPFVVARRPVAPPSLEDTECVARAIRGLSTISTVSWNEFFRQTSVVEATLRDDPAEVYAHMDFATCDRYRKVIERLARGTGLAEAEVARRAIAQTREAAGAGERRAHVGYWLVDEGRGPFEGALAYRPDWRERWRRRARRHATALYLLAFGMATAGITAVPGVYLYAVGADALSSAIAMLLVLLPASTLGNTVVQWLVTQLLPPRVLPKLGFEEAIPPEWKTAVVVPSLLTSPDDVRHLLIRIERHYLCNPDASLQFALLTDFTDAQAQRTPEDDELLRYATSGIRLLNAKLGVNGQGPFHLLHRERRYNAAEDCWMGWERKRGKLEELNRVLAGDRSTSYTLHEGDPQGLKDVRFVLTLDTDTLLPHGTAARLVGTLAHPLNRAELEPGTGRVCAGYTIVQPRVEISPESGNRSLFARLYAGDTTIDIYSRAVSDVYQDLFATGIYVGKGLYDVAAFHRSLDGRVPENALASHDLFEGIHGRVALATDVVLYEDYPPHYLALAQRMHRWIRGDWQLLPWLRRRVPGSGRSCLPNRLAAIDRWKILDNLRRSLLSPALLLLLAAGWLVLPGHPLAWMLLGILAPAGSLFSDLVTGLAHGRRRSALRGAAAGIARRLEEHAGRWLLLLAFLPHEAVVTSDAIVRTLVRLTMTRRHLLQWTPAAHTARRLAQRAPRLFVWRAMADAPLLAIALGAAAASWRPAALPIAAPLLLVWVFAPEIAHRISQPLRITHERLGPGQMAGLRRLARRTWLFFETFVGPDDQWLPPDNYQEDPHGDVAHRTSPTNVGMMFLSTMAAWDLGYLGFADLDFRLRSSLETLGRLEHYRGHMLNWYDTRTLEPLLPRYVSTVDSGNLAASLLALRQGCIEAVASPVLRPARWEGLLDTVMLLEEALDRLGTGGPIALRTPLLGQLAVIRRRARFARDDAHAWLRTVTELCEHECVTLNRLLAESVEAKGGTFDIAALREVRIWLERAHQHLRGMEHEAAMLTPWLAALETLSAAVVASGPDEALNDARQRLAELLPPTLSLDVIPERCARARKVVAEMRTFVRSAARNPDAGVATSRTSDAAADVARALEGLEHALETATEHAASLCKELLGLGVRAASEASSMDFSLLYDRESHVFHIGYNLTADRIDPHHYDLLASEARLASFVAIAKGDVPITHWYALGRPLTTAAGTLTLLSWGGTMFEYLMPPLLLHSPDSTLLGQSQRAAVDAQMAWGVRRHVPWGVSESGYAAVDADRHYQYRAFGVPTLGINRGLLGDAVVAPYATLLALSVRPLAAVENVRRMHALGLAGTYGLYEAADFTPARVPRGRRVSVVHAYMAHHQGMILAALDNHLCDGALVRRFHADQLVQAAELVLHERVPVGLVPETIPAEIEVPHPRREEAATLHAWMPVQAGAFPEIHVLGNGRLTSLVTDAGGGGLRWQGYALTRWTLDPTLDAAGLWIYVRDEESGALWSVGRQPIGVEAAEMDVVFHPHLAEFHRHDHGIALRMEVAVAPGDDVEIRRLTVINESARPRRLSFTSYGEVVLAPAADDEHHPAFSKLFVMGEHVGELDALVFTRRPRRPDERPPALMHRLVADSPTVTCAGFETDRARFLGRNGSTRAPRGFGRPLSGTVGATLDTVMSLRAVVELAPHATEHLAFLTLAAGSRESLLEVATSHGTLPSIEWVLDDAGREAGREVQQLGIHPERLPEFQKLASLLLGAPPALRCRPEVIAANQLGQPRLWGLGLSGEVPILLLRMTDAKDTALLRDLVGAHQLWRRRELAVDLVVLWQGVSGYENDVGERLNRVLQELGAHESLARRAGIHLLHADQMADEERRLVEVAAHAILDADGGALERQLLDLHPEPRYLPPFARPEGGPPSEPTPCLERPTDLLFDNGFGGFTPDGREYVIHLAPGEHTPAPWANVLANPGFGCLVTEAGGGYTWAQNSADHRLTPWRNDPVTDAPGEALYLRDEESAEMWTPTPQPAGGDTSCEVRHGAGYSEWRRMSNGLEQRLVVFVPVDDPVKIVRLELRNLQQAARRITATYYAEWVLGPRTSVTRPFVVTEYDAASAALLARNVWNPDFADGVAFLASDRRPHGFTTDRAEFLGREGDPSAPAALTRWGLSGTVRPGLDPCAALQVHLEIDAGAKVDVLFVLGMGRDRGHAQQLLARWRDPRTTTVAWQAMQAHWERLLGAVSVRTPEPALDLMMNRWLLYQTITSRILGRTGLYQSAGGFGFRDQLQDVMALLNVDPGLVRSHVLACAACQFEEGDVLHWWHPPVGRGVRTRCSDDLLWLPFVAAHYIEATGDLALLDEEVPFLVGPPLAASEQDRYARFDVGAERRSLFEHCRRALERGITSGPHGLPLIGNGDWNDAMNRVGQRGRGESVWMAWFTVATTAAMARLGDRRGETALADTWRRRASALVRAVEEAGWDGAWYRRAFDDDGRPWGSAACDECRIDSIAQSWAVLSGGAAAARASQALRSAGRELVREEEQLVRLLWPPFDTTPRDPGYIKAYPPGIRENGGQYTHAAAWLGWARAASGDGDGAIQILRLINPITHAGTRDDAIRYRVEPYVVAADIGSVPPHVGRGGWTWYTGSAAWAWRLGVEAILGLRRTEGHLRIDPCLPRDWPGFTATIRADGGMLEIEVDNREHSGRGVAEVTVDGTRLEGNVVTLPTDGAVHQVRVRLGTRTAPAAGRAGRQEASG